MILEGLHHISLGCSELDRSIAFYCDLLGFEVQEQADHYALLLLDPISIRLHVIPDFRSPVKNPGEMSLSFVLDVDDFTDAIAELEEKNVEILKGPVVIENGEAILIADPDGNLIELFYSEA